MLIDSHSSIISARKVVIVGCCRIAEDIESISDVEGWKLAETEGWKAAGSVFLRRVRKWKHVFEGWNFTDPQYKCGQLSSSLKIMSVTFQPCLNSVGSFPFL